MADDKIIDVNAVNQLLNSSSDVSKTLQSLVGMFSDLSQGSVSLEDSLKKISAELSNTSKGFGDNANNSALFARSALNSVISLDAFTVRLGGVSKAFEGLSKDSSNSTAKISQSLGELGGKGEYTAKIFEKMASKMGLGDVAKFAGGKISEMIQSAERIQDMEKNFISLSGAVGNLGNVFDSTGQISKNFDQTVENFNQNIFSAAEATGLSVGTITEATKGLASVPGALQTSVMAGTKAMSELVAATKIAAATGKNIEEVNKEIANSYSDLNLKGQGAIDFLSSIASLSSDLEIPLNNTSQSIKNLADKYAYLTNNTSGAVRAFAQFVPALQNAGLSPQQSIAMFDQMSSSIAKMTTASKAFLAQRSGFGSGLQGAFKIDQMVSEGKLDEVMQAMQKNLQRQFGGRVVTLDQASSSQKDAVQYQKQLEYLKSGAFGSLITDDQQASKLFKAMQSGDLSKATAQKVLTGKEATERVVARGSSVQERMQTVVGTISTNVQKLAYLEEQRLGKPVRDYLGTLGEAPAKKALENISNKAMAQTAMVEKTDETPLENRFLTMLGGAATNLSDLGKSFFGDKDQFGNLKKEEPKKTQPVAPKLSVMNQNHSALNDAIKTNMVTQSAMPQASANVLAVAKETNNSTITQNNEPLSVHVKGTIEGICLSCKTKMEAGHIEEAVVRATDQAGERNRSRIGMPVRK